MEITTTPSCRVGWEGATLRYVVKARGATEVLVPENDMDAAEVRIVNTRQVADGVEADLECKCSTPRPIEATCPSRRVPPREKYSRRSSKC